MHLNYRRRRIIKLVFLIAVWTLIAFIALEVLFRLDYFLISRNNRFARAERERWAHTWNVWTPQFWKKKSWEYKSNVGFSGRYQGKEYQIRMNSFGFRSPEIKVPKPEDKFRILCLGGSTTNAGRTNRTTYPALLERKLNSYFRTDAIEVVNCGISGLLSGGEKKKLGEYFKLEPDLILEYNLVNDIWWRIYPDLIYGDFWKRTLIKSMLISSLLGDYILSPVEVSGGLREYTISNLEEIYRFCQARGVKVVFAGFIRPDADRLDHEEKDFLNYSIRSFWNGKHDIDNYCQWVDIYNQQLEEMCEKNGLFFIPANKHLTGGLDLFLDICHLKEEGIEKKAGIIFDHLKEYLSPFLEEKGIITARKLQ